MNTLSQIIIPDDIKAAIKDLSEDAHDMCLLVYRLGVMDGRKEELIQHNATLRDLARRQA